MGGECVKDAYHVLKLSCVYQQIGGSEILVVLRKSFSILPFSFSVAFSALKNINGMQRILSGCGMYKLYTTFKDTSYHIW